MSLCEFGVVASQKKSLYVSVSFMGAMRESMKIRIYPWHKPHFLVSGVGHAISWWLLESMMNFDEPSHEQTTPTVESVCSSIRMLRHLPPLIKTRDRVPETGFGPFFFIGNFKHQNNSCVHKGHKGHKGHKQSKQSKQSMDSQVEPKFWASLPTEAPVRAKRVPIN